MSNQEPWLTERTGMLAIKWQIFLNKVENLPSHNYNKDFSFSYQLKLNEKNSQEKGRLEAIQIM